MARRLTPDRFPRFMMLASICVIVAALYFAQDVLIPLALAILFSFLLAPLVKRLERWRLPRVLAVSIVMTLALALVAAIGYMVYTQLVDLANELPAYRQNIRQKITAIRPQGDSVFRKVQEAAEDIRKIASEATTQPAQPTTQRTALTAPPTTRPSGTAENPLYVAPVEKQPSPLRLLEQTIGPIIPALGTAGIVVVFVIFMLLTREDMRDRLIRLVGHGRLHVTTQALDDAAKRISRYLLMQTIVNGTYGLAIAIGLWFIGVPNAALWGLLCALLRFIPYVGPWIAAAFPLIVSLASFPGLKEFVYTLILFVVVEVISNNFMEPWLYGSSTGMSTMAVLVSAVFWTWLWGPIGLVMATPMTVCLVVLGKHVPQLQFLDILLGDEPVLSPPERVYQRLLAGDDEEAGDLVEEFLKEQSLEEVYDTVLLPALAMTEQDNHAGRLDDELAQFIRNAMRDLIDELGDRERAGEIRRNADRALAEAKGEPPAPTATLAPAQAHGEAPAGPPLRRELLPEGCVVNVVCLPAHDDADAIVGMMLAQLLQLRGYCAFPISQEALASEMLDEVERNRADVVCVSAVPPAAVAHARYVCKRLHARFEGINTVVGLWTIKGDLKKAKGRLVCAEAVLVATTLEQALEQIHQFAQSKLFESQPAPASR